MYRIAVCFSLVLGMSLGIAGCAEKTKVQETKKIETPGGSTTQKTTVEETKTGEHKDPNP